MMIFRRKRHPAAESEVAAGWALAERPGLSADRLGERDDWLEEDPGHRIAYRSALHALDTLDRNAADPAILELRRQALAARPDRRAPSPALIAASLAVFLVAAGTLAWWSTPPRQLLPSAPEIVQAEPAPVAASAPAAVLRYATAVGERSSVTLPDGSLLVLDTASLAEVSYGETERAVRLLRGQAMFTVAHGQKAPFRVYAGDRIITATGTVFDVRLEGERVRVALVEGSVRVEPRPLNFEKGRSAVSPRAAETLSAGETLVAGPHEPVRVSTGDVARLTSWRAGLAIFENTRLSDAIAEINRYTDRPLALGDAKAAQHRLSGTFRTGEAERFARTMTELFPLDIETARDGRVVLKSRPPEK